MIAKKKKKDIYMCVEIIPEKKYVYAEKCTEKYREQIQRLWKFMHTDGF